MVMSVIGDRVRALSTGEERRTGALRVVPLVGASVGEPAYRLLGPETRALVDISEVGAGSVPNVLIRNRSKHRVLIMDSQTILGLRQNRAVSTDVLVGADETLTIPVTCEEQGRWGHPQSQSVSGTVSPRLVRSKRSQSVSDSLRRTGAFDADQIDVWRMVARYCHRSGTRSPSSAMHAVYEGSEGRLEEARKALTLPDGAVGVAVYFGSRFAGLDLFDKSDTMAEAWRGVLDSYLLDWIVMSPGDGEGEDEAAVESSVSDLLESLGGAEWTAFDAPGEGRSWRAESEELTASALVHDDQSVVHLQAFPRPRSERRTPERVHTTRPESEEEYERRLREIEEEANRLLRELEREGHIPGAQRRENQPTTPDRRGARSVRT